MNTTNPLPVLDPLAAFVDVGSEQMHVSIAGGPPEVFGTFTTPLLTNLLTVAQQQGLRKVINQKHVVDGVVSENSNERGCMQLLGISSEAAHRVIRDRPLRLRRETPETLVE
jgi:hypothetical protein